MEAANRYGVWLAKTGNPGTVNITNIRWKLTYRVTFGLLAFGAAAMLSGELMVSKE